MTRLLARRLERGLTQTPPPLPRPEAPVVPKPRGWTDAMLERRDRCVRSLKGRRGRRRVANPWGICTAAVGRAAERRRRSRRRSRK